MDARRNVTVKEAARTVGISRTKFYDIINSGGVRVVRFGRATRVPVEEVDRLAREGCPSN